MGGVLGSACMVPNVFMLFMFANPRQRLRLKLSLGVFIFTLNNKKMIKKLRNVIQACHVLQTLPTFIFLSFSKMTNIGTLN